METITKIIREIAVAFIKLYRLLLSPMLGPRCRFTPSCSEYAIESIRTHGVFKGAIYAIKRIVSCRPGGKHGYDPVPRINNKR